MLAEVGYADALLARELADGTLMLIDGHLRAETTPDAVVPVLVLDVDENEADKILLTHDPLAGMATVSDEQLRELLAEVQTENDAVRSMLAEIAAGRPGICRAVLCRAAGSSRPRKLPGRRRMSRRSRSANRVRENASGGLPMPCLDV